MAMHLCQFVSIVIFFIPFTLSFPMVSQKPVVVLIVKKHSSNFIRSEVSPSLNRHDYSR